MTARQNFHGHTIEYVDGRWQYSDGIPSDEYRPCPRCGRLPTAEGHDTCLGVIPGVSAACCGHGRDEHAYIMYTDGRVVSGAAAVAVLSELRRDTREAWE